MGRCPECRGQIKLGVMDRVDLLADYSQAVHPDHRPPYLHLIPLAEIIALALGHKSPLTSGVQFHYLKLTKEMTEIEVLLEADLAKLEVEPKIIEAIEAFRSGKVIVKPGGGGKYGEVALPQGAAGKEKQKSLFDY